MTDKPIYGLNDLLDGKSTFVLCDTMPFTHEHSAWFRNHVRRADRFEDIPQVVLEDVNEFHTALYMMYCTEGVATTPGVMGEMTIFFDIMSKHLNRLERTSSTNPIQRELLDNAVFAYQAAFQAADVVPIDQEGFYTALCDKVYEIADLARSKIAFRSQKAKPHKRTDEDLVATALYRTCIEKQPTNIATCDSDIGRIVNDVVHRLAIDGSVDALTALNAYPIKVFFARPNCTGKPEYEIVSDTSALAQIDQHYYCDVSVPQASRPRA
jgi:hypothetical protein